MKTAAKTIFAFLLIALLPPLWGGSGWGLYAQDNGKGDYTSGLMAYLKKDYATAMTHYQRAVGKGNAKAMLGIGDLYEGGYGVAKNSEEAKKWYEKGHQRYTVLAQADDAEAAGELADLYFTGKKYIEKNYAEALRYYLSKAERGERTDMRRVGHIYEYGGSGVNKDLKKAAEWYLKAHELGDDMSRELQRVGATVPKRGTAEEEYTKMLAQADNTADPSAHRGRAIALYADRLKKDGVPEAEINRKAKEKLLQMADIDFYGAYQGIMKLINIDTKELLATFSQPQQKVIRELAKHTTNKTTYPATAPAPGQPWSARGRTTIASTNTNTQTKPAGTTASGNKPANTASTGTSTAGATEYNKGLAAYNAKNYAEALKWYKLAADKGQPFAMNNLGIMYLTGNGVKIDDKEAFRWLKKAADKDVAAAIAPVGSMYYYGNGIDRNASEGFKWLKKAVDKGNTNVLGMEILAWAYEHGAGTTQNYTEAEKWYQKAVSAGSQTAAGPLNNIRANKPHLANAKAAHANSKVPKQLFLFQEEGSSEHGFKDETGKTVIPAGKYTIIEMFWDGFSEGLAQVIRDGKYGYINTDGKEVIPPKYEQAKGFSEGLAPVRMGDKWGFIDKTGKEIVPAKYEEVWNFTNGMAAVKRNGKWGFIDKTSKETTPMIYDNGIFFRDGLASVEIDGKPRYIDKTGKEVIPAGKYKIAYIFGEGLAKVNGNGQAWGFINTKGEEVIPIKYGNVENFSEGMAAFNMPYYQQKNHKLGYMDKTGKEIIPPRYDWAEDFSEGMAAVGNGEFKVMRRIGKWGFVDKTGREIVPLRYDNVGRFSEGLAAVKLLGQWGFIDKRGIVVIPLEYTAKFYLSDDIAPVFSNGVAEVFKDGKKILIDKTGKTIAVLGAAPKSK